jgi:methylenetetrahydrofolate dehydrogenase (NADP+)/methenyltetrahydrofolate cyclohydrolase
MKVFDGRKIRDKILAKLKAEIGQPTTDNRRPVLAVIFIGSDPVSLAYVNLKEKIAKKIGIKVKLYSFKETIALNKITDTVDQLNRDKEVSGIMVQIPVPAGLDRDEIIRHIDPEKDVDGLRYCLGLCPPVSGPNFLPPVVAAIDKAIELSAIDLKKVSVVIIGKGFLVGGPMARHLKGKSKKLTLVDARTHSLGEITKNADLIISATGAAGIIKPEMVKKGVVLIDAGTSEVGGKIRGDIDPAAYEKSSFYTPVPGGIGPVTVAMLMKNLVNKFQTT